MTKIKRYDLVVVWALLMGLTALSWQLAAGHGVAVRTATTVILVVALAKVAMIGHTFMEVNHSSRVLRVAFFGLSTLICILLVGIYRTV